MLAGQLNLIDPFNPGDLRAAPGNLDLSDAEETNFALVYSEVMSLCNDERTEAGAFSDGLNAEIEGDFASMQDARPLPFSNHRGLGDMRTQGAPVGSHQGSFPTPRPTSATLELPANKDPGPVQSGEFCGSSGHQRNSAGVLNKSQLSDWMDAHALTRSSHHCAMYCRLGMEAAGLNTTDRPQSGDAGDYGPFLLRHGAQTVSQASYAPQVGDVVVFDKTTEHPYGHIEMYDGRHWVSDFMQRTLSPYRDAASSPPYTIYRLG